MSKSSKNEICLVSYVIVFIINSLCSNNSEAALLSIAITKTVADVLPLNASKKICSSQPQQFPQHLFLEESKYINWAQQIELPHVWTATPQTADDIVTLANWAAEHGYNIRPRGQMHNWSPLIVTGEEGPCSRLILVDTTKFLTNMKMVALHDSSMGVTAEAGALVENVLAFLEDNGFGILGHPAPGDITVGGVVAIGGHGTGVAMEGQVGNRGTLSNLVVSINVIVWNEDVGAFEIQTFPRSHPETEVLILNLGRIFITEVTLEVTPLTYLRCLSRVDLSAKTLFADPKTVNFDDQTLTSFLDAAGGVETIWFPFTPNPWLKVWTVAPTKPLLSHRTVRPYNYAFTDTIPLELSDMADQIVSGSWGLAPLFGNLQIGIISAGLATTFTFDLWGPSHHVLLYIKPTTLRLTANGYALLTPRLNVQRVVHELTTFYEKLIQSFADDRKYPVNGPLEIRVSGLDKNPGKTFGPPALSALKPLPGKPEFDTAIWIDTLTFPNSPHMSEFMAQVESYLLHNLTKSDVIVLPEWSKGFAYTNNAGWDNWDFLTNFVPSVFGCDDWDFSLEIFKKYDPMEIFTNAFLRRLFK